MHAPVFMLSPCGTNVWIKNAAGRERSLINKYANEEWTEQIPEQDRAVLGKLIQRAEAGLLRASPEEAVRLSAELSDTLNDAEDEHQRESALRYHVKPFNLS